MKLGICALPAEMACATSSKFVEGPPDKSALSCPVITDLHDLKIQNGNEIRKRNSSFTLKKYIEVENSLFTNKSSRIVALTISAIANFLS